MTNKEYQEEINKFHAIKEKYISEYPIKVGDIVMYENEVFIVKDVKLEGYWNIKFRIKRADSWCTTVNEKDITKIDMKKYLNKGKLSQIIVTVIKTDGTYTLVSYPSGEIGEVLTSQLSDL